MKVVTLFRAPMLPLLFVVGGAGLPSADGKFQWRGEVDGKDEVEIRGKRHRVKDMGGSGTREKNFRFNGSLPSSDVPVSVRKTKGRGKVRLVQQNQSVERLGRRFHRG